MGRGGGQGGVLPQDASIVPCMLISASQQQHQHKHACVRAPVHTCAFDFVFDCVFVVCLSLPCLPPSNPLPGCCCVCWWSSDCSAVHHPPGCSW